MKLTDRELAAVLTGLRIVQQQVATARLRVFEDDELNSIYTGDGAFEGLNESEIDTLCERLNQ